MSAAQAKADVLARIEAARAEWQGLVAEVGAGRMEQPGPMGAWTFKDLAAHITGWRERTIARLEAAGRGEEAPPPQWPGHLHDDDDLGTSGINAWIYEQNRDRPLKDVLADADKSFERLAVAIAALPDQDIVSADRFPWMEGHSLAEADYNGHLREEHEPSIRAWLAGQQG